MYQLSKSLLTTSLWFSVHISWDEGRRVTDLQLIHYKGVVIDVLTKVNTRLFSSPSKYGMLSCELFNELTINIPGSSFSCRSDSLLLTKSSNHRTKHPNFPQSLQNKIHVSLSKKVTFELDLIYKKSLPQNSLKSQENKINLIIISKSLQNKIHLSLKKTR